MTDSPAVAPTCVSPYDPRIARLTPPLIVLTALALSACGAQKSTLPPAPTKSGAIDLHYLRTNPEVYSDATIETVGTVGQTGHGRFATYILLGGGSGAQIALEPTREFASYLGRSVRVRGTFTVSFAPGYEIDASSVTLADA